MQDGRIELNVICHLNSDISVLQAHRVSLDRYYDSPAGQEIQPAIFTLSPYYLTHHDSRLGLNLFI
jgi:hypothetical protein